MPVYINKNNQQSGPFEEHVIIDQLRSGTLSSDDLGIRPGETEWQRLGDMFPGVGPAQAEPIRVASPASANLGTTSVTADAPVSKGGCRKIAGIFLLIFGVLMFLGGIAGAIVNRTIQPETCEIADKYEREMSDAVKEADAAKGTSREAEAQAKAMDKIESAEIWTKGCVEARSVQNMFLIGMIAVAVVGLLMAIVGFFVRRV